MYNRTHTTLTPIVVGVMGTEVTRDCSFDGMVPLQEEGGKGNGRCWRLSRIRAGLEFVEITWGAIFLVGSEWRHLVGHVRTGANGCSANPERKHIIRGDGDSPRSACSEKSGTSEPDTSVYAIIHLSFISGRGGCLKYL